MPTLAQMLAATPTCAKCLRVAATRRRLRWWKRSWYCPTHGRVKV